MKSNLKLCSSYILLNFVSSRFFKFLYIRLAKYVVWNVNIDVGKKEIFSHSLDKIY